jgi:L-iditol 2-dehydrogenase
MRVTANVFAPCGDCFFCRKGQGNLCENLIYNFGAFAEYILLPEPIVRLTTYEIPSHLSYAEAAILEPLVSVVHSQRLIDIQPGEHVVVIGAGGAISLMHIQMAILSGATQIVAIGHNDFRLGLAGALGAADLINSKKTPDYLEKVNQLTHGRGADVVIECAGSKEAWEESIRLVRKGGRILWFGGLPGGTQVSLDANRIHYDELRLLGIHGGTIQDAEIAFELLTSGKIKSKPLISAEMPLEMLEEGLKRMASGEVVKVAINPGL